MTGGTGGAAGAPGLRISDVLYVRDQTDDTGRLLLEDSAPKKARKEAVKAGVAMKTATADFHDTPSRVGRAMNVSAYEAVRHDLPQVLDGFAWLVTNYTKLYPDRARSARALYDTSHMGLSLPPLLFYRADDPVGPYKKLPSHIASLFKASRGLFSVAVDLVNDAGSDGGRLTGAKVVAFAEATGNFRREATGRTCAAPTRLIERAVDVVLSGDGADAGRAELPRFVDFERLWEFCAIEDAFGEALSRYRFMLESAAGGDAYRHPRELLDRRVAEAGGQRLGALTDSLLNHVNMLQDELNRLLARGRCPRPLTFEAVIGLL